jgi:hypothetical protein
MLGRVRSTALPASGKRHDRILWFSFPIFEYHHRHRHAGGDRIGSRGRAILHERLRKVLADIIAGVMRHEFRQKSTRQVPAELLAEYVASTFVLVLNWWLEKRMPSSPEEVNDVFRQLTLPTLAALWE